MSSNQTSPEGDKIVLIQAEEVEPEDAGFASKDMVDDVICDPNFKPGTGGSMFAQMNPSMK